MKRKEQIEVLLSEGFSAKTLINFNDKQVNSLYKRIVIKEESKPTKVSSKTPNLKTVLQDLKNQGIDDVEITEEDELSINKKSGIFAAKKLKEWVNNAVDKKYSAFTSKSEIMEMIKTKLKNEDKMPEFMTYDAIAGTATAPTIAPTKPKTTPKIKPKTPYSPGPGKNPKPKAMGRNHTNENKKGKRK